MMCADAHPRHRRQRLRRLADRSATAVAGPRGARPRARSSTAAVAGGRSCAATRSPAKAWLRRSTDVEVAYYLIHSMERIDHTREAARPFAGARAHRRRELRRGGQRGGRAADRLPRRPARDFLRRTPSLASLASREGVERILLAAVPGLGRAARVDRDRRALALVSPARAARRAHARARAARVAPLSHAADRRARRHRDARSPRRRRRSAGVRSTSAGPDVLSYGEMIERIADLMLVSRPAIGLGVSADRRDGARRCGDRAARTPSWCCR